MYCWRARRRITEYVDGRLRNPERSRISSHVQECESCALAFEQLRSIRSTLSELPAARPPAYLRTALRVAASQERRILARHNGSRWRQFYENWSFRFNQIMRPLTIPATGGLLSSVILFAALAFTISTSTRGVTYEVPVLYADRNEANLVPVQLRSSVVLTLSLDGNGRITDYAFRDASASYVGDPMRLQANNILLPDFPSVLVLEHPISRDISIEFTPLIFRQ